MIPATIHQLWVDPHDTLRQTAPVPADIVVNSTAWQELHPDFVYRLWSLDNILSMTKLYDRPEVYAGIRACRFPAMQADIIRLFLLEMVGGFWIDLKLCPRKSFLGALVNDELVVTEHFPKDNLPQPNGFLSNSFLGARPGHPKISQALDIALRNVRQRMTGSIFYVTGAPVLIEAIRNLPHQTYRMLDHHLAWNELFSISGGSYNDNGQHWSQRQDQEPAFNSL
ncbi:glycosyltransferase family 32 protein [Acidiphilium sp.]|uniref:glycosyltransferase family 32 protein n=1 Tax=Acidiphilium sp. TaxID=527 RepID=UPI0025859670|nr:glycosyltransferase [Acidiphilium sp.]